MEPSSVNKFLASYNITEGSIEVIGISDRYTRKPDSLIVPDDYLNQQGVDQQGVRISGTLWFSLSKWRQRRVRKLEVSSPVKAQNRSWMWVAIAISQFWFLTLLNLPAKAQCQDEVSQNWLQLSIELITESLRF